MANLLVPCLVILATSTILLLAQVTGATLIHAWSGFSLVGLVDTRHSEMGERAWEPAGQNSVIRR